MKRIILIILLFLTGCVDLPEGITPVRDFELERYLGKWYEIARLDHRFERGLINISAEYSLKEDGGVRVLNRGFNVEYKEWESAEGKAYFVDRPDIGRLKVSFFGPFYGGYNIIALDKENYSYAMVAGPDRSYLWILSRTPILAPNIVERLVNQANELGFPTDELIYTEQTL